MDNELIGKCEECGVDNLSLTFFNYRNLCEACIAEQPENDAEEENDVDYSEGF